MKNEPLLNKTTEVKVDPGAEDLYWRDAYVSCYYVDDAPYETFQPAYKTGYEGFSRYPGKSFEDAEADLARDYEKETSGVGLSWEKAKLAAQDAWLRLENRFKPKHKQMA